MTTTTVLIIEIILLIAIMPIVFFVLAMALLSFFGVPWVATKARVARAMFELAQVKPGETVVDFGCGDASLLITAAKEFKAKGVGYDFNPVLCVWARLRTRLAKVSDRIEIRCQNFFKIDLPQADVIACYLLPGVQEKLEPHLIKAYPSGTRVVAHAFKYPSLKLENKTRLPSGEAVYLYRIP